MREKSDQTGLNWIGTKNEQDCDLAKPKRKPNLEKFLGTEERFDSTAY
jgi:hypothetical protein